MSRQPIQPPIKPPSKPLVLIVDDDPDLTALTEVHVRRWGYSAHSVGSAQQLRRVLENQAPDVVLLDVMLGDADGTELVPEIHRRRPSVPVIMITRSTSV
ncbi:MAG: response regulator, partial [Acidobacteriota bacterium]|nr:response regulator [Acidobacteriota bacterium]